MKAVLVDNDDVPEILGWYKKHDFVIDEGLLPVRGFWVKDLACAWLYESDSALGQLGFPVINPDAHKGHAFKALGVVFDKIHEVAKSLNMAIITTSFSHISLQRLAGMKGYKMIDRNVETHWRVV